MTTIETGFPGKSDWISWQVKASTLAIYLGLRIKPCCHENCKKSQNPEPHINLPGFKPFEYFMCAHIINEVSLNFLSDL